MSNDIEIHAEFMRIANDYFNDTRIFINAIHLSWVYLGDGKRIVDSVSIQSEKQRVSPLKPPTI